MNKETQPLDRETEVREWEKTANSSLVADDRNKKASGAAILVAAVIAIGLIWYMKNDDSQTKSADQDLTIAERKPVQKLKEQEPEIVAPIDVVPAPTPMQGNSMQAQLDQMELQRKEQERRMLEARLKSAIIPPNSSNIAPTNPQPGQGGGSLLGSGNSDRGAQDSNSRFARLVSGNPVEISKASQVSNLDYKILQGKIIEAVLEPRAVSDLPGMICANVQRDVYGSHGRIPLIPWGSKVCGVYSADIRKGQDRIFVVWNTLRRPDGVEVTLDSFGADQLGSVGMGGFVDNHFAQIFGVSALLSIIGAGASNIGVSSTDQNNSAAQYRQSVQEAAANSSQQVLQPYANIPPTIKVPPASQIRIYVNRDLDFTPIYKAEIEQKKQSDDITFIN